MEITRNMIYVFVSNLVSALFEIKQIQNKIKTE
jgi:hypothetical protein